MWPCEQQTFANVFIKQQFLNCLINSKTSNIQITANFNIRNRNESINWRKQFCHDVQSPQVKCKRLLQLYTQFFSMHNIRRLIYDSISALQREREKIKNKKATKEIQIHSTIWCRHTTQDTRHTYEQQRVMPIACIMPCIFPFFFSNINKKGEEI